MFFLFANKRFDPPYIRDVPQGMVREGGAGMGKG